MEFLLEAEKPTQNPEIPKKAPRSHELFRKVRANFCPLPCDTSQEASGNCSEKTCSDALFYSGWIFSGGFSFSDLWDFVAPNHVRESANRALVIVL